MAIRSHLMGFSEHVGLQSWNALPARKIRYIHERQRIFECTDIDDRYWDKNDPTFFCDKVLELAEKSDLVIAADFGHGMFEGVVLAMMEEIKPFVALNVQTNSSNFGFNVYTKHKRFDYLCIDTREARLALHDRWITQSDLFSAMVRSGKMTRWTSVTKGPNGAALCFFSLSKGSKIHSSPAFTDGVVDATGAGDAYFAITACLLKTDCLPELIPFIGNVFAGLKCKVVGNKSAVSKAALIKACEGILK